MKNKLTFFTLMLLILVACKRYYKEEVIDRYSNGQVAEKRFYYKEDELRCRVEIYSREGILLKAGDYKNYSKIGIWTEYDTVRQITSLGKYIEKIDTHEFASMDPPYEVNDSIIFSQVKDSIWNFYDSNNKLLQTIKYDKGDTAK